jgi:hypothetical protein
MEPEEIAQACLDQAEWCARLGSPMYQALLQRMAEDVRAGGPSLTALDSHTAHPRMRPLMLLGAIHRMVLEGALPEAGRFYPSMGGQADVDALWPRFLEAVPRAALPVSLQTNEVGRSCALLPGFLEVARRTGLPLRLFEIGASAGLNLRWDRFPFLGVPSTIRVVERRGCDLNPIDPTLDESRLALLSFVWPDQTGRLERLAEAIEIARRVPAQVDRCDAVDWLRIHLSVPQPGAATVIFHSVVLLYLRQEGRENVCRVIEDAGGRATSDAPLAWLSMEPGADQADIHLTIWPGGERRLIARSGFHGGDVKVL